MKKLVKNLGILSTKPRILVCNVDENSVSTGNNYSGKIKDKFKKIKAKCQFLKG